MDVGLVMLLNNHPEAVNLAVALRNNFVGGAAPRAVNLTAAPPHEADVVAMSFVTVVPGRIMRPHWMDQRMELERQME